MKLNEKKKIKVMEVEEKGALVLTKDHVGVTNEYSDVAKVVKKAIEEGTTPVYIKPGYKTELLNLQNSILLMDEVYNSLGKDKIAIPAKMNDYNLTERKRIEETEKILHEALLFAHEK